MDTMENDKVINEDLKLPKDQRQNRNFNTEIKDEMSEDDIVVKNQNFNLIQSNRQPNTNINVNNSNNFNINTNDQQKNSNRNNNHIQQPIIKAHNANNLSSNVNTNNTNNNLNVQVNNDIDNKNKLKSVILMEQNNAIDFGDLLNNINLKEENSSNTNKNKKTSQDKDNFSGYEFNNLNNNQNYNPNNNSTKNNLNNLDYDFNSQAENKDDDYGYEFNKKPIKQNNGNVNDFGYSDYYYDVNDKDLNYQIKNDVNNYKIDKKVKNKNNNLNINLEYGAKNNSKPTIKEESHGKSSLAIEQIDQINLRKKLILQDNQIQYYEEGYKSFYNQINNLSKYSLALLDEETLKFQIDLIFEELILNLGKYNYLIILIT